ncbi:MAG: MGMT family protein [Parcubacteria group bacterium]
MKKHSKVGSRKGLPTYRTPSQFKSKVLSIVKKIPKGEILTYKDVAKKAGRSEAYRAVGNILNKNYDKKVPCHRVIRSDGKIGGYNNGVKAKKNLLKKEGFIK